MMPVRFVAVGALGLAVQLGTVLIAVYVLQVSAVIGTAAGVILAVLHNFVWHRRWTWADRRANAVRSFFRFAGASGTIALAGNVGIVWLLLDVAPIHPAVANLVAVTCCAWANYLANDKLVFVSRSAFGDPCAVASSPVPQP